MSDSINESASEPTPRTKPEHYKVVCVSFYNEDLENLDAIVRSLKRNGYTKANRSAVLRAAMEQFDPAKVAVLSKRGRGM